MRMFINKYLKLYVNSVHIRRNSGCPSIMWACTNNLHGCQLHPSLCCNCWKAMELGQSCLNWHKQTNDTNCVWGTYLFESGRKVLGPRPCFQGSCYGLHTERSKKHLRWDAEQLEVAYHLDGGGGGLEYISIWNSLWFQWTTYIFNIFIH
jgi:hypothetical protein